MNKYNPDIHHRRSIRLRGYDYSQEGLYFVTVCTQHHVYLFGEIADGEMRLNETGEIVEKCWLAIPQHYPDTVLHNHIVMPNHFHGIIEIARMGVENIRMGVENIRMGVENVRMGVENIRPLHEIHPTDLQPDNKMCENNGVEDNKVEDIRPSRRPKCESGTIGAIIRGFKIGTTKSIGYSPWQRNYYEHIIRNHADYARIADYIARNPANWNIDCYYNTR